MSPLTPINLYVNHESCNQISNLETNRIETLSELDHKIRTLYGIVCRKTDVINKRKTDVKTRKDNVKLLREAITSDGELKVRLVNKEKKIKEALKCDENHLEKRFKEVVGYLDGLKIQKSKLLLEKNKIQQKKELVRIEKFNAIEKIQNLIFFSNPEERNDYLVKNIQQAEQRFRDVEIKKLESERELEQLQDQNTELNQILIIKKGKLNKFLIDVEAKETALKCSNFQLERNKQNNQIRENSILNLKELLGIKIEALKFEEKKSKLNRKEIQEKIDLLIQSFETKTGPVLKEKFQAQKPKTKKRWLI